MDATRAIQAAVARADLLICRARDAPVWAVLAALAAGVILYKILRRCAK